MRCSEFGSDCQCDGSEDMYVCCKQRRGGPGEDEAGSASITAAILLFAGAAVMQLHKLYLPTPSHCWLESIPVSPNDDSDRDAGGR